MSNLQALVNSREKKGINFAGSGESVKKLSKHVFKVRSQSGYGWYLVRRTEDANIWSCSCPDFSYMLIKMQDKRFKHIISIQTLLETHETANRVEKLPERPKICPVCLSTDIVKNSSSNSKPGSVAEINDLLVNVPVAIRKTITILEKALIIN